MPGKPDSQICLEVQVEGRDEYARLGGNGRVARSIASVEAIKC